MSFNHLLRDAQPETFARAAKTMAEGVLSGVESETRHNERTLKGARRIIEMTHEELVEFKQNWDIRRANAVEPPAEV